MAFKLADFVKETTTSTGTGSIALAGAATGYQAFSAKLTIGDTTTYSIRAVDGTGAPTGEWELAGGTYTGVNTLSRDTVLASSNSDASVSFSAGTKEVYITMPSMRAAWVRERLTADRTYYVRTDGSDSNTGLANTSGGAFLTIQQAVNAACSLDLAIYGCTIQVADGTYTGATVLKSYLGAGPITIRGNASTPADVFLSCSSSSVFYNPGATGSYIIKDLKGQTTSGAIISAVGTTAVVSFGNLVFGSSTASHIEARQGATVTAISNYAISGGSSTGGHVYAISAGVIITSTRTVTITGTPSFAAAFAWADRGLGMIDAYGMTFSGSATGKRYIINNNSVCFVNGAATTYFPGSIAGTTATGGQYA